jgi:hypothetical protein
MSGKPNLETNFVEHGKDRYRSSYQDVSGNRWRVDVTGDSDIVKWFVERRPCYIQATPTKLEVLTQQIAQVAEEIAGTVDKAGDTQAIGSPSLDLTFALESLANESSPYVVNFEIDPPIDQQQGSQKHTFKLKGQDVQVNLHYACTFGTVSVEVAGNGMRQKNEPGSNGDINIPRVPLSSAWEITVFWHSGSPADYTLSGDISVGM